jgi:hypothetical protein
MARDGWKHPRGRGVTVGCMAAEVIGIRRMRGPRRERRSFPNAKWRSDPESVLVDDLKTFQNRDDFTLRVGIAISEVGVAAKRLRSMPRKEDWKRCMSNSSEQTSYVEIEGILFEVVE